jgi:hypothetical protein
MSRPAELPLRLEAEGVFVDRACANRVFALGSGGAHGTLRPAPCTALEAGHCLLWPLCSRRNAQVRLDAVNRDEGGSMSIVPDPGAGLDWRSLDLRG